MGYTSLDADFPLGQPMGTSCPEFTYRCLFVTGSVICIQHTLPPSIDTLVNERLRTSLSEHTLQRHAE